MAVSPFYAPIFRAIDPCAHKRDVCFWHIADMRELSGNVRYWGKADIEPLPANLDL